MLWYGQANETFHENSKIIHFCKNDDGQVYLEKKKRMMDEKEKKNDDGQVYLEKMSPRKPI